MTWTVILKALFRKAFKITYFLVPIYKAARATERCLAPRMGRACLNFKIQGWAKVCARAHQRVCDGHASLCPSYA